MAAFKFIRQISTGKPIDKYGDGSAIREFTYVDDIVSGVVSAIDRPKGFLCVNLGGGATHTLNELIATVEKHVGREAVFNQMPDQKGDVPLTSADQGVAKAELGFVPTIGLDEGIRRTVEWYREYSAAPAEANGASSCCKGSNGHGPGHALQRPDSAGRWHPGFGTVAIFFLVALAAS
jgi:UDP-glucuronate 4-epimerase